MIKGQLTSGREIGRNVFKKAENTYYLFVFSLFNVQHERMKKSEGESGRAHPLNC